MTVCADRSSDARKRELGGSGLGREDFLPFLIRAAVPKASGALPPGLKESDLVWDAVWRAHRDVSSGRQYVEAYSEYGRPPYAPDKNAPNAVPSLLYGMLVGGRRFIGKLASPALIEELLDRVGEEFPDKKCDRAALFGPAQKLVNMALKYLVLLQTFGASDGAIDGLPAIDPVLCDCPVDRAIVEAAWGGAGDRPKWTSMSEGDYLVIQDAIEIDPIQSGKSRLAYDLENWQDLRLKEKSARLAETS